MMLYLIKFTSILPKYVLEAVLMKLMKFNSHFCGILWESISKILPHILKGTSITKSELVLLEWIPRLYLRFVLYDICQHFYYCHV